MKSDDKGGYTKWIDECFHCKNFFNCTLDHSKSDYCVSYIDKRGDKDNERSNKSC